MTLMIPSPDCVLLNRINLVAACVVCIYDQDFNRESLTTAARNSDVRC
jgi:hypothetical protein